MKRVALFALVFAAGLALLWLVQRAIRPPAEPVLAEPPPPAALGPEVAEVQTELPEGDGSIQIGGETTVSRYDGPGGPLLYRVSAADVRQVSGEVYDLLSVTMEFFEPTGELSTSISAASARVQARLAESGFELEESHENVLSDVEVVLYTGTPLAPLRLRVPSLGLRLDDQRLASDGEVLIEGRGLAITGQGLLVDRDAETVEIRREPLARMRFDDDTRAVLEGRRSLRLTALGAGDQRTVELTADDARLDFDTGAPARLSAQTIRLVGTAAQEEAPGADPAGDDETRFTPHVVEALGRAAFVTADGIFEGDRGELSFDAAGAAERAVLVGQPRFRVDLSDVELGDLAELESAPGGLGLEASGAGPLEVFLGPAPAVSFAGPVELRMPSIDLKVDARSGVSGSRDPTGERLVLSIRGAVVVTHGAATLTAPELSIDSLVDERGRRSARMTSPGPTRTQGQLADGRPFDLLTAGALSLERGTGGFRVPHAEGIELEVRGEEPFVARADTLRDFVEEPLALVAEGQVRFASAAGEGSAERLQVVDPEHVVLTGASGEPARFDLEAGWLEAQTIELAGAEVTASDGAVVRYELEGAEYDLRSDFARIDRSGWLEGQESEGLVLLDALGNVAVSVRNPEGWSAEVAADRLRVKAIEPAPDEPSAAPEELEPHELTAEGHVRFGYSADFELRGDAERLVLRADGSGELRPPPDGRLALEGQLPKDDTHFSMSCRAAQFSSKHLIAEDPDLRAQGPAVELGGASGGGGRLRAVAGRMASDETSILLTGGAHISQLGGDGKDWFLYADKVLLTGTPEASEGEGPALEAFRDLLAWDGFVASFGGELRVTGDSLQLLRETQLLRLAGDPAVIELPAFQWSATRFELDLVTGVVRAGPGSLQSSESMQESWRLSYSSIEPVIYPGETIQVIREPVIASRDEELRASWALFWIDNRKWLSMSREALGSGEPSAEPLPESTQRRPPHPDSLFGRIQLVGGAEWLRELYFEGNVAYTKDGRRVARVDSLYLDLVDGHGWIRDIDLAIDLPFMEGRPLKLRARWMRHSADGSYFASNAVATTCDHEKPHYVVRIGDLRIDPRKKERKRRPSDGPGEGPVVEHDGWEISTRNTSLGLSNQLEVPLPRLAVPVTPDLQLDTERLSLGGLHPFRFGSDSKLGTFVGTSVRRDLGWLARGMHRLLLGVEAPEIDLDGQTDYRASWNNDRGLLLGLTSELVAQGRYWAQFAIDGLFDSGEDEGLIQVPEDERSSWRGWYRTRGRYLLDEEEWLDLAVTVQDDAAVQSEFFEDEFLEFEERESYVHWRRAQGPDYLAATVEAYPNDFQSEIVTQGALHSRARSAIAGLTDEIPLLYSSGTSLGFLQREIGDPRFPSPFDERFLSTGFPAPGGGNTSDGWGEEQTLRFDTSQRLEAPVALGFAGLRATPFLEARGTAWQIGADVNSKTGAVSAEDPTRLALLGGAELGTSFWRRFQGGVRHLVSPFIGFRTDLLLEQESEPLITFDQVENPVDGRFFDLGVRNRLESKVSGSYLDVELVETYAEDAADGTINGWLPLEVNAEALTQVGRVGMGIKHDALYDLETDLTPYSRTIFGVDPLPNIGIEMGYHSARDTAGQRLYNALSASALYAMSAKWEMEARYVFSTQGNERLSSEFELRRLGHDFVFEVSTRFQAGEGSGTSIQFDIIPLVTYDAPGNSLVERWREQRY